MSRFVLSGKHHFLSRAQSFSFSHHTKKNLLAAIDQSTTGSKLAVFDLEGKLISQNLIPHRQITKQSSWLEHDPSEIMDNVNVAIEDTLKDLHIKGYSANNIITLGITNQRETFVCWNRKTGKPYHNAIVWSDARTKDICQRILKNCGGDKNHFKHKTGLPIATYFSAFKARWLLENVPEISRDLDNAMFGTMDTFVNYNLTGNFRTDVTNASRTFLFDITSRKWDSDLLKEFGIPEHCLPQVFPSAADFGTIKSGPLAGISVGALIGDQHAACLGHGIFESGQVKHTYGTGCFLMMNIGKKPKFNPKSGLLCTMLFQLGSQDPLYALEGSIECGGSTINWLRDKLGLFKDFKEMSEMLEILPNNEGVYFVPAFNGLFSPFWRDDVSGMLMGLSGHANKSHIVRATLEAICYRTKDVIDAMEKESGLEISCLNVDGGITVNDFLMQFQSDVLQKKLKKTKIKDSTCLGAAFAAGYTAGVWKEFEDLGDKIKTEKQFAFDEEKKKEFEEYYQKWQFCLEKSMNWK